MAQASIRDKVISAARGEVGYARKASKWNKYAAAIYPSVQNQPYCGIFVAWVILQAGADTRKVTWMPYVPYIERWARANGAWKTSGQKAGDLVVFDWGGDGVSDHVGIAWPDASASGYRSIEGNTSAGSSGSQSNGGRVAVRYRGRKSIRGWVDLDKLVAAAGYKAATEVVANVAASASGALVVDGKLGRRTAQEIQQRLKSGVPGLSVDGRIGAATLRAWQAHEGTPVDGRITGQAVSAESLGNGLVPAAFVKGSGGSSLVKKLQANLNRSRTDKLAVDGKLGPATIKALQTELNRNTNALVR